MLKTLNHKSTECIKDERGDTDNWSPLKNCSKNTTVLGLFSLCITLCRKQFFSACSNIYTALFHLNVFININQFPPQHYDIAKNYPELTDWELKITFGYDVKERRKFPSRLRAEFKVWAPACHRVEGSCLRVCLSLSSATTHKEPRAEPCWTLDMPGQPGYIAEDLCKLVSGYSLGWISNFSSLGPDVQSLLCIHLRLNSLKK